MLSIKKRLTISFILVAILPLVATGLLLSVRTFEHQKKDAIQMQAETALRVSERFSDFISRVTGKMTLTASLLSSHLGDVKKCNAVIGELGFRFFNKIILLSEKGEQLGRGSRVELDITGHHSDFTKQKFFTIPLREKNTYYGPIRFDKNTHEPLMIISLPVNELLSDKVPAVLMAEVRLRHVWEIVRRYSGGSGHTLLILDEKDRIIAHPNQSLVLKGTTWHIVQKGQQMGLKGEEVVLAYQKVSFPGRNFKVVAFLPADIALKPAYDSLKILILILVGALIFGAVFALVVLKGIVGPIDGLVQVVNRFRQGCLSARAEVVRQDEIGHLATVFNLMAQRLRENLQELNQEIQERRQTETALTESQEKFIKAFHASPHWLTIVTLHDGRFLEVNDAFCRALGKKRQEIIGCTSVELGIWGENEDRKLHLQALRETGSLREAETEMFTKDGLKNTVLWSAEKIKLGGQECLISVVTDITQRKKLEAQVRQAQKMEAIGTLAGGIAHDFNNILQAIIGYCQLLQMEQESAKEREEHVGQIMSAGLRAVSLVRRLLTFSRKVDLVLEPLTLNRSVDSVAEMLFRTIPKMVEIKTNLAEDLHMVKVDPVQMEQVLMNLGINASDAMDGSGILTFETKNFYVEEPLPDLNAGQYVLLTVTDTGCGMDSETIARIFEPFYTTKKPGKGTGLGLSTAYGIVKAHGGKITCYSRPGEGTSFYIYLPALVEAGEVASRTDTETSKQVKGTETVLLVDDEPDVLSFASSVLTRFGYKVLTADNGGKALNLCKESDNGIALVVLDLDMPEMGGAECAVELEAHHKGLNIIIASGHAPESRKLGAAGEKVAAFLNKPYMAKDLLQTVRSVLDKKQEKGI